MSRNIDTQTCVVWTDEAHPEAPPGEAAHQAPSHAPRSNETSPSVTSIPSASAEHPSNPLRLPSPTARQGVSFPPLAPIAARDAAMYPNHGESQTITDIGQVHRKRHGPDLTKGTSGARRLRTTPLQHSQQGLLTRNSSTELSTQSPQSKQAVLSDVTSIEHSEPPSPASAVSQPPPSVQMKRYGLHIRQQPVSARAGPPGRDRRPIDPPCILQLMITDFDTFSAEDVADLKDHSFQVYCALRPVHQPRKGEEHNDSWKAEMSETQKYLIGEKMGIAWFSPVDPDPEQAPRHPSSRIWSSETSVRRQSAPMPAIFFVFHDLSVRRAGRYRLEFTLIEMDAAAILDPGGTIPVHAHIMSDVFECYNAKDFPSIKPSTRLVRGLREQGCSKIPLKKGAGDRRGQGAANDDDGD
ncbi:MAG: hypothetical protein Q9160_008876 [Pyrenula sp. 1 TL-2023]